MIAVLFALLLAVPMQDAGANPAEELARRISEQLAEIDEALSDAADADAVTSQIERARLSHLSVIRDIEELIRQVKYQRSQQSSGQSGEPNPSSGQQQGQPQPREQDSQRAPEPQGETPEQGEQPSEQQQGSQDKPEGGAPDNQRPDQREAKLPPPDDTQPFLREDTDGRWGLLPPKLQERLMNLHVDDVPERYRLWMDAYIRAINRRDQQGGG